MTVTITKDWEPLTPYLTVTVTVPKKNSASRVAIFDIFISNTGVYYAKWTSKDPFGFLECHSNEIGELIKYVTERVTKIMADIVAAEEAREEKQQAKK